MQIVTAENMVCEKYMWRYSSHSPHTDTPPLSTTITTIINQTHISLDPYTPLKPNQAACTHKYIHTDEIHTQRHTLKTDCPSRTLVCGENKKKTSQT